MELSTSFHTNSTSDITETNNFLTKYYHINNKLKKRFMRNPNVADASDEFLSLASQCEQEQSWQYAGLCFLAVSKCSHMLGNTEAEINYLLKAGKYFLLVNEQNKHVGCPSIGLADIQAALSCFSSVTDLCKTDSIHNVMIAGYITELAQALGPISASRQLLKKAINIYPTIQSINTLISYSLKQDDYTTALNIVTDVINLIEIMGSSSEYYRRFLHKAEVNRLMLSLMVQRTSQRLSPPLTEIIEKFTSGTNNSGMVSHIDEDEFFALQSLILACQSHDKQTLLEIEGELWKYLDTDQKDFLRTLIQIVIDE